MARLRSKSCRNKISTERVSSGEAESLGATAPAGECGVKDQVRRADSLIFVEVELEYRVFYGECAMKHPVFLRFGICTARIAAQNYPRT